MPRCLQDIADEIDELIARGAWDRDAFRRLLAEAEALARFGDETEFVYFHADPEWIERFDDGPSPANRTVDASRSETRGRSH